MSTGSLSEEQQHFFEDLLAYLREELEARKDPEGVEQRARMFAFLGGEAGRAWVFRDKHLAEKGLIYMAKKGKRQLKHIDELTPHDVPAIMAEMEATVAVSGEYMEEDGVVYVLEYGGHKVTTPDVGDPSAPLRARWNELKNAW